MEIQIEKNGELYIAEYCISDDSLTVFLPDGSQRYTELRGLQPKSAAEVHLRAYVNSLERKSLKST